MLARKFRHALCLSLIIALGVIPLTIGQAKFVQLEQVAEKYYYLQQPKLSWFNALRQCAGYGLRLLTLELDSESFLCHKFFLNKNPKLLNAEYWTGASISGNTKNWIWFHTGDTIRQKPQDDFIPKLDKCTKSACLKVVFERDGFAFKSENCSMKMRSICELS